MLNKIAIIIHGPIKDNAYKKIFTSLQYLKKSKLCYQLYITGYIKEKEEILTLCQDYEKDFPINYVFCKDLLNPGYFNLNRQIYTVKTALDHIQENTFIIKLRNDQWINWGKLLKILDALNYLKNRSQTIITTNCYTRKDRLYHPSDMFLCGWWKDMVDYFSLLPNQAPHLNCQLFMLDQLRTSSQPFVNFLISPESELFRSYLLKKQWDIKWTFDDSYDALLKYVYILNTWDIDLKWNKKRNANLPSGTIILPYRFCMEPFKGAPKEKARCFMRQDFHGKKRIRDIYFLTL